MKRFWLLSLPVVALFAGCGLFNVGTGSSDGTGGGVGGTSAATTSGGVAQGVDCGADPNTGVTLCLGNTLCSGVQVDQTVYPGCGFLINANLISVECVCGTSLCPLGTTTSCSAVQALLAQDNEGVVCAQAGDGTCTDLGTTSTSSSGGGGGGGSGGCDPTCEAECAGDPTCIEYTCGC